MRTGVTLAALAALGLAGCVLAPVDLTGRPCPCAQGWSCVEGVCLPAGSDAGTPPDSGPDAGSDDDAGLPDDGGPDGGPGVTRCDDLHADAVFCDGFEWAYPDGRAGWDWDLIVDGELDTVASPPPFLGERALRASTTLAGGRAAIGATLPEADAIVDGDLWLRAFFYIPSELAVEAVSMLYIGSDDGSAGISIQMYEGGQAAAWIGTADDWRGTGTPLPRDAWTCLQLHVLVSQVGGEVEVYVDDLRFGRWTGLDTLPVNADGFRAIEAGIEYSSAEQGPTTLYVDEVVLSRTRVPCQ